MSSANWRSTNSPNVIWVDTRNRRGMVMEDDTSYHAETLNQGRDATNPVPRVSMFAGKPCPDYEAELSHEDWLWRRRQLIYVLTVNFAALGALALLLYWAAS